MNWDYYLESRNWLRRYAVGLAARCRPDLGREEAASLADLGLVLAAKRFDATRGYAFTTYARRWVAGEVLRAGREAAHWSRAEPWCAVADTSTGIDSVHARIALRSALAKTSKAERHVLWVHGAQGHSLAEASRAVGRHRAWGHRAWKGLVARAKKGI